MEVRFQDLTVEAQAEAAGRELPSIFNSYRNWVEVSHRIVQRIGNAKKGGSLSEQPGQCLRQHKCR